MADIDSSSLLAHRRRSRPNPPLCNVDAASSLEFLLRCAIKHRCEQVIAGLSSPVNSPD
jgi:hypothetical protein